MIDRYTQIIKVGDIVSHIHPFDGSELAGKPMGRLLIVRDIRDHKPIDGPVTEKCIAFFLTIAGLLLGTYIKSGVIMKFGTLKLGQVFFSQGKVYAKLYRATSSGRRCICGEKQFAYNATNFNNPVHFRKKVSERSVLRIIF